MSGTKSIIDPNTRMISGPVNVVRLKGNIHNINKVIYLFMDYHINVTSQTQCENIFSEDIQKYFTNSFYHLSEENKMYDFFVEIYPSELASTKYQKEIPQKDYKKKYIEEVVKIFRKIFRYDPKKNKVSVNKLFKSVRLHYLDVRDYFKHGLFDKMSELSEICHGFMVADDINPLDLNNVINLMQSIKDHLELTINILKKTINKVPKTKIIKEKPTDIESLEYLANKMKKSYKHSDVKNVMNMLIVDSIKNFKYTIEEIEADTKTFKTYVDDIIASNGKLIKDTNTSYLYNYGLSSYSIRYMIIDIVNKIESLNDEKIVEFFARFTDIYFLRRFLDKDYITNAIVYSGALHSNTYVYMLVKYFDFKITHASYTKVHNLNKLTDEIKKKSLMEIQELILPRTFDQCSNMENFPIDFL